ncbi:MAG: hypothetical protein V1707_00705 [bacterium]
MNWIEPLVNTLFKDRFNRYCLLAQGILVICIIAVTVAWQKMIPGEEAIFRFTSYYGVDQLGAKGLIWWWLIGALVVTILGLLSLFPLYKQQPLAGQTVVVSTLTVLFIALVALSFLLYINLSGRV